MNSSVISGNRPTIAQLERELKRVSGKRGAKRFLKIVKITVYVLLMAVAVLMIVSSFMMPVLKVYGDSMEPNTADGDIVVCLKCSSFEQGDVIAFNHDGKVLIRRIIGKSGDKIDVHDDGSVYVNGSLLDEPYIKSKNAGTSDIDFPYTVPKDSYFVMGDNRKTAIDSRCKEIGTVKTDDIIGKLLVCIWPINSVKIGLDI